MEALACGTPVVAFRRGALPGIVEPNRTGILVDNPSELPDAILAASRIDPAECRRIAIERFSCDAMTPKYLTLYQDLASANLTNRTAAPWPGATAVQTVS
jgi:glycosyltransferase involved in cell wall biosynthesis